MGEEKRSRTDPRTAILQGDPPLGPPPLCSRSLDKLQSQGAPDELGVIITRQFFFRHLKLGMASVATQSISVGKDQFWKLYSIKLKCHKFSPQQCWEGVVENRGPPPLSRGPVSYQVSGGIILEIKHTINVMCLNHPKTVPLPWSAEKMSPMKSVPGAKEPGDRWLRRPTLHKDARTALESLLSHAATSSRCKRKKRS